METALVLRTCSAEMTSHGDFQWPDKVGAKVEAPDWMPNAECGNGLHGWLYGQGDYSCSAYIGPDAKWLVVRVPLADIVMLDGRCKFPSCVVEFIGGKKDATDFLIANEVRALGAAVIGAQVVVGDREGATSGALGTATAGYRGTATAGDGGTATAGGHGTATAGGHGTATAGGYGTATAGEYGTATAGGYGTATAGGHGTATAGGHGTATAGDGGTATAGGHGTATAGEHGTLGIKWYDSAKNRYRIEIAYTGEDGIEANVPYRLDENHKFVKA